HHFGASVPAVLSFRKALGLSSRSPRRVPERTPPQEFELPEELRDATQFRHQFGTRLQELREAAGLTQKELQERVKLSWWKVHEAEIGAKHVPLLAAPRLAAALGVPLATLLEPPTREWADSRGRPSRVFTRRGVTHPSPRVERRKD